MNICFFITNVYPYRTGEEFIESEIQYLSRIFEKVYILSISGKLSDTVRNVPKNVIVFPLNISNSFFKYVYSLIVGLFVKTIYHNKITKPFRIKKLLFSLYFKGRSIIIERKIKKTIKNKKICLENKEIIIYSYWLSAQSLAAVLLKKDLFDKGFKVHAFSRAHGFDLYSYRNKLNYSPYRNSILMNLDYIYPCSKNGTIYLQNDYPIYREKIKCQYLGTQDYGLNPINLNNKEFEIITCSNIIPLKRLDLLVKILSSLTTRKVNYHWTCIGDGSSLVSIKKLCKKEKIENFVSFLGRKNPNEIKNLYLKKPFDLFINISEYEGLPVSIMEAYSFGIPCLASNVGGTSEIVQDTLFLFDVNDSIKNIAERIIWYKKLSVDKKNIFRKECRKQWEIKYSANKNYESFYKQIEQVIEKEK